MRLLDKDGSVITDIDFDEVFVGDSKELQYYLYNDSGTDITDIDISFRSQDKELIEEITLIDYPKELDIGEKGLVKIRWTPNLRLKKGLKVKVKINAIENWRPKE